MKHTLQQAVFYFNLEHPKATRADVVWKQQVDHWQVNIYFHGIVRSAEYRVEQYLPGIETSEKYLSQAISEI